MTRNFVSVPARHPDVGQHDVRRGCVDPRNRLVAVADRDHGDRFTGERQLDDALDRHAVIDKEKGLRHVSL
jgi:hypothetical protein